MKKVFLFCIISCFIINLTKAQTTTVVNYDFNSGSSYPIQPLTTATNITCTGTSSEAFQMYTGTASGSSAFVQNTTSGNALAMANSGGTNTRYFLFQLGGSELNSYSAYSLYLQPQRSSTGATTITVAYSTNGSSYTNLATTYTVGTNFNDVLIDLSSATALNNASAVYIKLMVSGASQTTGTIRIDNLQVQANKGPAGGNPWQVSGYDVSLAGKLGIGNSNPVYPLDVTGAANFNGALTARQGLTFASGKGIKETIMSNGNTIYTYGKGSGGSGNIILPTLPCFNPVTYPSAFVDHQMPGIVQIYPSDAAGNYLNNGSVLNMQSWETVSSIDVAGGTGLLMNYFCGKDVAICTGNNTTSSNGKGGVVAMGHNVMIGGPWPANNYDIALNINGVEQTGLFVKSVHTTNPYNYGVVSSVNGKTNKAFAVLLQDANNDKEVISLRGNGETFFGTSNSTIKPTLYVSPSVNTSNQYVTGKVGIGTDAPTTALDVKGDVTVSNLGNGTIRTLLVDGTGKLVPGTVSSTTATAWSLGGNNITNPSTEWFGTKSGSEQPIDFYTNGFRRIRLDKDGHFIIGYPYGGETEMMHINAFNEDGFILINSSAYPDPVQPTQPIVIKEAGIKISNNNGNVVLKQDADGIAHLGWLGGTQNSPVFSSYFSFKGESVLLGSPDANFKAANSNTINTKLTISTNSNNGYTSIPLRIVNPLVSNQNKTIFEVAPTGFTTIAVGDPTETNALDIIDRATGTEKYLFRVKKDGRVFSREINVLPANIAFPDYVFEKNYKLESLEYVETYIRENKHLPSIPSAKEVSEKGIDVADMFVKQMEKIENLYLYLIELKKENEQLKRDVEYLMNK